MGIDQQAEQTDSMEEESQRPEEHNWGSANKKGQKNYGTVHKGGKYRQATYWEGKEGEEAYEKDMVKDKQWGGGKGW